ncbi:substrate-binding domain-containing protein [Winogradskya humida]|uniref:VWFA domain-containing protein n=1 Tax=Winogradskya humida TaxID=113566 RepID=A0ABQ3ZYZ7_9ACTN|nr:substrate-binding domain-containing protein [Actinoplanes humidus]GIE23778.1 hypothetical protein Ahu01nite_068800 [Actinoplanes humidus]
MAAARSALIIAVNDYLDDNLDDLRAPLRDAAALKGVLDNPAIGAFDKVTILPNPTADVARRALENFFKRGGATEVRVCHFSGHAFRGPSSDSLYLAMHDTQTEDYPESSSVPSDWLANLIKISPARYKLLLLDCCHGGLFKFRGPDGGETLDSADVGETLTRSVGKFAPAPAIPIANGRAAVAIAAARAGQGSVEKRHGALSEAIIEGLSTGDAGRADSEWITPDDLLAYAKEWFTKTGLHQSPVGTQHENTADFFVARNLSYRPLIPPDVEELLRSPTPATRYTGIEKLDMVASSGAAGAAQAVRTRLQRLVQDNRGSQIGEVAQVVLLRNSLTVSPAAAGFGRVRRGTTVPAQEITVAVPHLGDRWQAECADPAVTLTRHPGRLEIAIDPARRGDIAATVTVTSAMGDAEIPVTATVTRPEIPWHVPAFPPLPRRLHLPRFTDAGRRTAATLACGAAVLLTTTSAHLVPKVQLQGWCIPTQDLPVLTTQSLQPALERAAREFESSHTSTDCADTQVRVSITALSSDGLAERRIAEQWPDTADADPRATPEVAAAADAEARMAGPAPQVWVPESSVQVELARTAMGGTAPLSLNLPAAAEISEASVAASPFVLAVPDSPGSPVHLTWKQVLQDGWRFPRPDPRNSTTGLLATYALYEAASDDRDAEKILRPSLGGDDLRNDLCRLRLSTDAPPAGTAFLMPEKYVSDYNAGRPLGDGCPVANTAPVTTTLKVVESSTPAPALDVPCVTLTGIPASDGAQHELAEAFCDHLHSAKGLAALRADGLAAPRSSAAMPNPGTGAAKKVIDTWTSAQRPVRVLLAMDVSGSMKLTPPGSSTQRIETVRAAARTAVERSEMAPGDEVGVWRFATHLSGSRDYAELVPLASATGDQQSRAAAALASLTATTADTGLYDTIQAGVRTLAEGTTATAGLDPVNRLVVLTDGENDDDPTAATVQDLATDLRTHDVEVSIIASVGADCAPFEPLYKFDLTCVEKGADELAAAFAKALPSRAVTPS